MKKAIPIIILVILILGGVGIYFYFQNVDNQNVELENKMATASKSYFEKYVSANDSVNTYKITLEDLENANKNGENYDLKGLEKCDKTRTFSNVTINYKNGKAKDAQVELKC